jgi:hypothetical protein
MITAADLVPRLVRLMWLASAILVGLLGWLLFAISDWPQERIAGVVLLAVALLGTIASALPGLTGITPRRLGLAVSGVFLLGGVVASLVMVSGPAGAGDLLLVLGVPAACSAVTGWIALSRPA